MFPSMEYIRGLLKKTFIDRISVSLFIIFNNFQHQGEILAFLSTLIALIGAIFVYKHITRIPPNILLRVNLDMCYEELKEAVDKTNFNPLLLRLAWSDAVTYDCNLGNHFFF